MLHKKIILHRFNVEIVNPSPKDYQDLENVINLQLNNTRTELETALDDLSEYQLVAEVYIEGKNFRILSDEHVLLDDIRTKILMNQPLHSNTEES